MRLRGLLPGIFYVGWLAGAMAAAPLPSGGVWWSTAPLESPGIPALSEGETAWARTPIDAFVLARLQQEGLTPSPEADRRTLIRRLSFDLIGLPPSPERVQAFVEDADPLAYEKLVDELLDSPRHGERWARHWLDVAGYADSHGYDKDKPRPNAWPYRDYVIRSLNEDKPYGRFVREQIAGDVLFPGSPDGILGLGFIAAGPWDFIGHWEVPETKIDGQIARNLDRDEMVSRTFNVFLSTTVQCARCHNHKFDPITQEDYYNLQSVFAAVDRAERVYDLDPEIVARRHELEGKLESLRLATRELDASVKKTGGEPLTALDKQIKELSERAALAEKDVAFGYHSQIADQPDVEKWVQLDLGEAREFEEIVLRPCHDDYNSIGAGFGFPVRFRVEASLSEDFAERILVADETSADFVNPGLAPVACQKTVKARFVRVTATRLARRLNDYNFALAEIEVRDPAGKNIALGAKVSALDSIESRPRWSQRNVTDGKWARSADESAALALWTATRERLDLMARLNTPEIQQQRASLEAEQAATRKALNGLPEGKLVYAAATDFKGGSNFRPTGGRPREVHLLRRGDIGQPAELSVPGTLRMVAAKGGPFDLPRDHTEGQSRAALAEWITARDNPLPWRSLVNRVWLYHFGQGLVASPNDFGHMGRLPSHPELLDWLAANFRDGGQSLKDLHRLIVNSAVYRQVSTPVEGSLPDAWRKAEAVDGDNRLLWRMNRQRLDAESIRDAVLSVSGKLNTAMYGPPFQDFVVEKPEHSPHYEYHLYDPADPATHRRSIYRFIVRSQPQPFMTTLDCADPAISVPQRDETITALQSLTMLNNKFMLAMSENFAKRLEAEGQALPGRIDAAFRLAIGREPTAQERADLVAFASEFGLDNVCRLILNLNEFVFVD